MTQETLTQNFSMEIHDWGYTLHGIPYRETVASVDWHKGPLHKFLITQDEWVEVLKDIGWVLPSGVLYQSTLSTLFQNRGGPFRDEIEQLRGFFENQFTRMERIMTGTRVDYKEDGFDEVIHGYGTPPQESRTQAKLIGPQLKAPIESFVEQRSEIEDALEALLGTRDLKEVTQVSEWLVNQEPELIRNGYYNPDFSSRALTLGGGYVSSIGAGRHCIDAGTPVTQTYPALGVRIRDVA